MENGGDNFRGEARQRLFVKLDGQGFENRFLIWKEYHKEERLWNRDKHLLEYCSTRTGKGKMTKADFRF